MKIKGLVGTAIFVFTCALLVPLYESYNAIGYIIAGIVGCITAGISTFILAKWLGKQEEKEASVLQIQNTLLESKQQLIEQQERFVSSTKLIQEQLQKVMIESVGFQQQSLAQMMAAVNEMSLIGVNQKDQTSLMVSQLDSFTTRLINLFEERIQEDLNVIRESKDLISNNLIQLRQEVEQAELRHEVFLVKLESSFSGVVEIVATNQKTQASQLKQHLSEIKVASEDHLDDTKDALTDILKLQRRENRDVMEEIQSTHKSLLEELVTQGTRQQSNLDLLQRLQEEIMDLNKQDLQMISKLMQEV